MTAQPSLTELLQTLRARDIRVTVDQGELRLRAPAGALTDDLRHALRAHKAELLTLLTRGASGPLPPIPVTARTGAVPLSAAQRRLWFLDALNTDGPAAYNIAAAFTVEGALDLPAFTAAMHDVVARHESLRTGIRDSGGTPVGMLAHTAAVPVSIVDLSTAEHPDDAFRSAAAALADMRFDPANPPLVRVAVHRLAPQRHGCVIVVHHLAADGESMPLLIRDLSASYSARRAGQEPALPVLPIQYADFAAWQDAADQSAHAAYWRERFRELPDPLQLPTEGPRPTTQSFNGHTVRFTVSRETTEGLNAIARRAQASLFMALVAATATILERWTGQRDITIGTPARGRPHPDLEGLVGCFVNTLALRCRLQPEAPFAAALEDVRRVVIEAFDRESYPFDQLVDQLALRRDTGRSPLFGVMVILAPDTPASLTLDGLTVTPIDLPRDVSQLDLTVTFAAAANGGLDASLQYRTDLFSTARMSRLAAHLATGLDGLAADATRPLRMVPSMPPGEIVRVVRDLNATTAPHDTSATLIGRFEAQAARTPDAVAVIDETRAWTYADIDARATHVAHTLRARGVQTGTRVALLARRGERMMSGILGILRAGAAYVPIQPGDPQRRIDHLLADCRPTAVLRDTDLDAWEPGSASHALPRVDPRDVAYVIYTSGSTGQPKGVEIEHGSAVNRLEWMDRAYRLAPGDVVLQKTPFTFDVSVWELFWWAFSGAAVAFLAPDAEKDPAAIVDAVARHRVTTMHFVPSMLRAFLDHLEDEPAALGRLSSLRDLFASGEALTADLVARVRRTLLAAHGTRLHNLYGPTEATVDVSFFDCFAHPETAIVPIGAPVANTSLYVLDRDLSPAPFGVTGEIYIGGLNVGRGYLGRPDLTADRFMPDPFSSTAGARLYRTGDLGRWGETGQLEYLGRNDQQVKIRGHRIELGEIEAVLRSHPGVNNAAVLAEGDTLVAYLTAPADLTLTDLRAFLSSRLPAVMVPAQFVPVSSWPLTSSGKLDRRVLRAVAQPALTGDRSFVAPRTPTERALADIIARVLDVPAVGVDDDFFERGGHSLLATRVIAQARQSVGLDLTLQDLFAHPTVAGLASCAEAREPFRGQPLHPVVRQSHYAVSHAQRRLWLAEHRAPSAAYNVAVAFTGAGVLNVDALTTAWQRLQSRHESLRTAFREVGGEPRQWIAEAPAVSVDVADLPAEAFAAEAARLAAEPFDLRTPPLVRMAVRRFGPDAFGWIVVMHHIVCDGWSIPLLVRELATAYADAQASRPTEWTPLRVQYKDYAGWMARLLDEGALDAQRAYWRAVFPSAPPRLALPFDTGARSGNPQSPERVIVILDAVTTQALVSLGRAHHASLFMTLTATVQTLLYQYTGQTDLTIGTVTAGRIHPDTEPQIGFYVNTLALRTTLDPAASFTSTLGHVRERAIEAFDHQAYPFDRLVDEVDLPADGRFPLFDVLIVLQNNVRADLTLPGVSLTPVALPATGDKFDLTFHFAELAGTLELTLEFRAARYPRAAVTAMAGEFSRLVSAILAAPTQSLETLPRPDGAVREHTIAIASTFTAEPIEEVLSFWMAQLRQPTAVTFAPFGQMFQALLDSSSVIGRNRLGANVCLIRFADWQQAPRGLTPRSTDAARALEGHDTHRLPSGATVAHLNAYETDDVFQEIFVDRVYERHGMTIHDGDVVFDIGANIGLFSLFADASAHGVRLFSFEPAPPTFEALRRNAAAYCANARVFNCGIGAADGEAPFTFYPKSSVFSSYHPDAVADAASVRAVVRNVVEREGVSSTALVSAATDTLMADRMTAHTVVVPVRSLSSVMREHGIDYIDLLKLDAEKSERVILAGLSDDDWSRIRQIVMEVHDQGDGTMDAVRALVEGHGFSVIVEEETRLHESGLFTLYGRRADAPRTTRAGDAVSECVEAVRAAAGRTPSVPMLVVVCPDAAGAGAADEARFLDATRALQNVTVVSSAALAAHYPVVHAFDARTDALGAVPYTPEMYAAIGTTIARRLDAMRRRPVKVIALDADQTLWRGVVGEDGPGGIVIDPPQKALQTFMRDARAEGLLLCLVSKNTEADVARAFAAHPEMPLQWSDFAARRVNWAPKSDNLRSLAAELNVGLDSFVFVDDNPLECAEVQAACPEVLALCLPAQAEEIPAALRGAWAFDRSAVTAEDAARAAFYAAAGEREQLKSAAPTLKAFLNSLDVQIRIAPVTDSDVPRAAQLSQRTNQFNTTTRRRSDADVRAQCGTDRGMSVVRVADRFGDYGLVGVVSYVMDAQAVVCDAMMLSCRTLGRGVEHQMVRMLGDAAASAARSFVDIQFVASAKNRPARDFLDRLPGVDTRMDGDTILYRLDANTARALTFDPDAAAHSDAPITEEPTTTTTTVRHHVDRDLFTADAIASATAAWADRSPVRARRARLTHRTIVPPQSDIEQQLAEIWRDVLRLDDVGITESFFDLGGHSLKAIRMLSRAAGVIGAELTLGDVFADPTIAGLAARTAEPVTPIPRALVMETYPVSGAQRRLWILNEMSREGSAAYNVPAAFVIEDAVDATALERAFRRVIARHEALRTRFITVEDEPRQEVIADPAFALERGEAELDEATFARTAAELASQPLPFDRAPLLRAVVHPLTSGHTGLVVVVHHVATDGGSMPILVRELFRAYDEHRRGIETAWTPLRVQYKDYTLWSQARLDGPAGASDRAFWHEMFATMPPTLDVPADAPRPAMQSFRGGTITVPIDAELTARLRELSRQRGATLFMTLLAALDVWLYRVSGESDVTVGTPITGRMHPDLAEQVGFYVNTLALRTTVIPDESFASLLNRVKARVSAAFRHQTYPFDRLVDELRVPRHLGRSPLFDIMLVVEEEANAALQLPDIDVRPLSVRHDISRFDMTFHIAAEGDELLLGLQYSAALFTPQRVTAFGQQFATLLRALARDTTAPVAALPLLTDSDRDRIMMWSRGHVQARHQCSLVERFSAVARARAEHPALVGHDGELLSYQELDTQARHIAGRLRSRGVRAGQIVAVEAPRSVFTVVAMLGVMQAGAVYLPVDPALPEDRRAFLRRDSGAVSVLTPADADADVQPIVDGPAAADLAYVIYTSGSTGTPKGVAVTHASLENMVADQIAGFGLGPGDVFGQFSSVSFDASLYEVFLALLSGATLALVPDDARIDRRAFVEWSARAGITVFVLPPAFVRTLDREDLPSVRLLITAGDAADAADARHYASRARYVNAYGPTECAVCATWSEITTATLDTPAPVPIGRAVTNTAAYVLNARGELVPPGQPGELYLGGAGVALGYLGRTALTAERFVPDPFSGVPGARLYRTGDLARWRADGQLEFIGRNDFQVKVRGHRIELGEVENAIRSAPGVRDAVVIARTLDLVAYVTGDAVDDAAVRAHVRSQLPDYMIPAFIVVLAHLPLNASGKVDRPALPAPDASVRHVFQAPTSDLERTIAAAWCAVLERDAVGTRDSFFDLGGNSILLARVLTQLRRDLAPDLTLLDLFTYPRIEDLAAHVSAGRASSRDAAATTDVATRAARQRIALKQRRPTR